jgi:hypothetical protein
MSSPVVVIIIIIILHGGHVHVSYCPFSPIFIHFGPRSWPLGGDIGRHFHSADDDAWRLALLISLHSVVTLLDFCRRYGVHYTLLSPCVGYFACPGIDTPVQGTTVISLIRQTLFLFTAFVCALAWIEPAHCQPLGY